MKKTPRILLTAGRSSAGCPEEAARQGEIHGGGVMRQRRPFSGRTTFTLQGTSSICERTTFTLLYKEHNSFLANARRGQKPRPCFYDQSSMCSDYCGVLAQTAFSAFVCAFRQFCFEPMYKNDQKYKKSKNSCLREHRIVAPFFRSRRAGFAQHFPFSPLLQ